MTRPLPIHGICPTQYYNTLSWLGNNPIPGTLNTDQVGTYSDQSVIQSALPSTRKNNPLPPCQLHAPHLSFSLDAGIFAGYGGGFTLGVDIDFDSGAVTPFRSFRVGQGIGLTLGLSAGLSNSGPTAGISSSTNASIGLGSGGGGLSQPINGGPTSINGGASLGPKVGFELSKTDNLTYTADISAKSEPLCH